MYAAYRLSQLFLQVELWLFILLLAVLIASWRTSRMRSGRTLLLFTVVAFYLLSIPPIGKAVINPLESAYPPFRAATTQGQYQAIVVLTGGIRWEPHTQSYTIFGRSSLPRLLCGMKLFKEGQAPMLVLSGGPSDPFVRQPPEASVMKDFAMHLGIPDSAMVTEIRSRTTAESAIALRPRLSQFQRIILVTSAFHIPRATALFQKQGFEVAAAPCAYEVSGNGAEFSDFIPNNESFKLINFAIHEYIGLAIYRALGQL